DEHRALARARRGRDQRRLRVLAADEARRQREGRAGVLRLLGGRGLEEAVAVERLDDGHALGAAARAELLAGGDGLAARQAARRQLGAAAQAAPLARSARRLAARAGHGRKLDARLAFVSRVVVTSQLSIDVRPLLPGHDVFGGDRRLERAELLAA